MSGADDRDALLRIAQLLREQSGISLQGVNAEVVQTRLGRRMRALGVSSLAGYATLLEGRRAGEIEQFINLMTTNHTFFFRERPHLDFVTNTFLPRFVDSGGTSLNVLCAACSTGEEVYTLAILIDQFMRVSGRRIQAKITGMDINTEALRIATNGVYPEKRLAEVQDHVKNAYFQRGRFPKDRFYRVAESLRSMVKFSPLNLIRPVQVYQRFDLVFCRNVLIYFEPAHVRQVVKFLRGLIRQDGVLVSGLSERIEHLDSTIVSLGRSIHAVVPSSRYAKGATIARPAAGTSARPTPAPATPTPAPSPSPARPSPSPVIVSPSPRPPVESGAPARRPMLIVIGASTGGTTAIAKLLPRLPTSFPPIVIAQHIGKEFSARFVESLQSACPQPVHEATELLEVEDGHVYVAPGGRHLRLTALGKTGRVACRLSNRPANLRFVPSVDLMFESAAKLPDRMVVGVVLTGMGDDGAKGAAVLRRAGHYVVVQDEGSSVVYGMPAAVEKAGAAHRTVSLDVLPTVLAQWVQRQHVKPRAA